jgi:hypothetical protein
MDLEVGGLPKIIEGFRARIPHDSLNGHHAMKGPIHFNSHRAIICVALDFALLSASTLRAQIAGRVDTASNPNVEGQYVLATAVQPDGKILIGGFFSSFNGQPRGAIARLDNGPATQRLTFYIRNIGNATTAGAFSKRIEQAQRHLARGDTKARGEKCYRGIHDYSLARRRAARAKGP